MYVIKFPFSITQIANDTISIETSRGPVFEQAVCEFWTAAGATEADLLAAASLATTHLIKSVIKVEERLGRS